MEGRVASINKNKKGNENETSSVFRKYTYSFCKTTNKKQLKKIHTKTI
jgi:hypothetical protein